MREEYEVCSVMGETSVRAAARSKLDDAEEALEQTSKHQRSLQLHRGVIDAHNGWWMLMAIL